MATWKGPTAAYLARARALSDAIDIALRVRTAALGARRAADMNKFEREVQKMALAPARPFAKLASLRSLESDFFTFWNESSDPYVKKFWREVARKKLPFEREDPAREALERGRIANDGVYEVVADALGDDRFTKAEQRRLAGLLAAFEGRRA